MQLQPYRYWLDIVEDGMGIPIRIPLLVAKGIEEGPVVGITAAVGNPSLFHKGMIRDGLTGKHNLLGYLGLADTEVEEISDGPLSVKNLIGFIVIWVVLLLSIQQ